MHLILIGAAVVTSNHPYGRNRKNPKTLESNNNAVY